MKFTCSVTIDKSREEVVRLWEDPKHFASWQDAFLDATPLEGESGDSGSKTRLTYKQGKGTMILTETIIENDLPNRFEGLYEHKHMVNTMATYFKELSPSSTLMESEVHYTEFRSIIPKIMAWVFPGLFRKQVQKWMNNFKAFAEAQSS